jgi:hypothetical protein
MSRDTASSERDTELAQLRAELAELRAAVVARPPPAAPHDCRSAKQAQAPAAPACTLEGAGHQPPQHLPRRGVMAGVAALAGAGLAKLFAPGRAEATHGGGTDPTALHVGQDNIESGLTRLFRFSNTQGDAFQVINQRGVAIFAQGDLYGVYGDSTNLTGVFGQSTNSMGVNGVSRAAAATTPLGQLGGVVGTGDSNHGVLGQTNAPAGSGMAGVFGRALLNGSPGGAAYGVLGESGSSHGVLGRTNAPVGTVTDGMLAAGVAGRTSSTIALYGFADGPPNASYAPVGAVGQCQNGFGVWGLSSAGPGAASRPGGGSPTAISGVLGTSTSGLGVYAISSGSYALAADGNGPNTVGVLGRGLGGGRAAVFVGNVEVQGHLTVTGGINGPVGAVPSAADGRGVASTASTLQAVQSPEALVEGLGQGRLAGGQAAIRFDATLGSLLADDQYDVFLTEYDDHHALYVTNRTRQGFDVRAKDSPTASGTFSYRVVARARTARATEAPPLHVPTIPVPQGVPTLPVGREPPAAPPSRNTADR